MKLSEKQQSKAIQKINEINEGKCIFCKSELFLNQNIFELRQFNGGDFIVGGETTILPVVALTCSKCGYTHLFSAVFLGILDRDE